MSTQGRRSLGRAAPLLSAVDRGDVETPPLGRGRSGLAYAGVLGVALCATLTWFRPGRFIASGDITPFIFDGYRHEYPWLWNHALSGAGSRSFQIAYSGFIWIGSIVHAFGGSDELAQRIVLVGLVAGVGLGAAYFVGAFTDRQAVVAASGVLGVFNAFVLITVPNPLVLASLGVMGLVGGTMFRVAAGGRCRTWVFASGTVVTSVLAFNPAMLAVVVGWVGVVLGLTWAMWGRVGVARAGRFLLRAAPLVLLLNAWWLVPAAMTLLSPEGSLPIAQRDVVAWSWTQARSSLSNVTTMTSAWGLDHREYFPYAGRLGAPPWSLLRFGLPLAAFAAPLVTSGRRRRLSVALTAVALVSIFVGKGLHPPVGDANLWLYRHVPGFWLLREPATKAGLVQVLTYVALAALTASAVLDLRRATTGATRRVLTAAPIVGVVAAAAFPYPLWTGAVIADARPLLPSAHVAVPAAWHDAARFLNQSSARGKILVLPLDDYYQMPTTWGYYGADVLPQSLLTAPVLARTGDGYFGNVAGFQDQVNAVEQALLDGEVSAVSRLFESLDISHVLLRHDFDTAFPDRSFTDPARLDAPLAQVPGLREGKAFGPLTVFSVSGEWRGPVRAYGSLVRAVGADDQPIADLVRGAAPDVAVVRGVENTDGVALRLEGGSSSMPFELSGAGPFVVSQGATAAQSYTVRRTGGAASPSLELSLAHDVVIDGLPLMRKSKVLPLPTADVPAVRIGGAIHPLTDQDSVLAIPPSTPIVVLGAAPAASALTPFGPVGDCFRVDGATASESGLRAVPLAGQAEPAFRLEAAQHSACISANVTAFVPGTPYRLHFDYRSVAGAPPRACVWQEPVQHCADVPSVGAASEWTTYDTLLVPNPAAASLSLYLYADAPTSPGTGTTRAEYRGVTVSALRPVLTAPVDPSDFTVSAPSLAEGSHVLSAGDAPKPVDIGAFSDLADCANGDGRTAAQAGLGLRLPEGPDGVVQLWSRTHSACVSASVPNYQSGRSYRLRLDYRTVRGATARLCVWQESAERCAKTPALELSTQWRHLETTVTPSDRATGLDLFLYADGPGRGETRVEFRDASLLPTSDAPVIFVSRASSGSPPPVSSRSAGPARYDVQIGAATEPFILGLPESYSSGWRLTGLPPGTLVDHVVLDGYANGWRIGGVLPDRLQLVAKYQPAFLARTALTTSLWGALALAVGLVAISAGRRLPAGRELRRGVAAQSCGLLPVDDRRVVLPEVSRLLSPAAVVPTVGEGHATPAWLAPSRKRLALGAVLGVAALVCVVAGSASSAAGLLLVAGALALAVLGPPWQWTFGAGWALVALAAAAGGVRLTAVSDALVLAGLVALLVAIVAAAGQDTVFRPVAVPIAPVRRRLDRPVAALPARADARPAFYLDNHTYITEIDARLRRMAELVHDLGMHAVLDVGCGDGVLLRELARHGTYELHGVDVYPDDAADRPWYRSADITHGLPYADGRFDGVILGEVLEHVVDPDALLAEVRRVLRPGGYLVISTPNLVCWANRMLVPLGVQPLFTETSTEVNMGRYLTALGQGRQVVGHLKVFTHRSLEELLQRTGYRVLLREGVPFSFPFPLSLVDRAFSRFPSVASGLVYVARRDDSS